MITNVLLAYVFHFILGSTAEGGEHVSTLPDDILDQRPSIDELLSHARTGKYNELGIVLSLDSVDLTNCHDCISVYQLWLEEKAENATRRNLLAALKEIRQNNVIRKYENYLKTRVSYIVHASMYTCTESGSLAKNTPILLPVNKLSLSCCFNSSLVLK